jgi:hypothetical protein
MSGWRGRLLKEWTVLGTISGGHGTAGDAVSICRGSRNGIFGTIRPRPHRRIPSHTIPRAAGAHLNCCGLHPRRSPGQWGTAGRNSITGPIQFSLDSSLARTFRPTALLSRLHGDATNLLNHAVFTGWNTTVNSSAIRPSAPGGPMRSLQTTVRLRF